MSTKISDTNPCNSAPWPLEPRRRIVLAPELAGSIERYAAIAAAGDAVVAEGLPFDKRRKSVHRMAIADTRGRLELTVPIAKPDSSRSARWADIALSDHGNWWAVHFTALESAYGRTPFFEFYADRFAPLYADFPGGSAVGFDARIEAVICDILDIKAPRRDASLSERPTALKPCQLPYWQVRADKLGFIPGLSILDLIFNLGPDAQLFLYGCARSGILSY